MVGEKIHLYNYIIAIGDVGTKIINTDPIKEVNHEENIHNKYIGISTSKEDFETCIAEEKVLLSSVDDKERLSDVLGKLNDPLWTFIITDENETNIALSEFVAEVLLQNFYSLIVGIVISSNEGRAFKTIKNANVNFYLPEKKANKDIVKFFKGTIEMTSLVAVICVDFADVRTALENGICVFDYGIVQENGTDYEELRRQSVQLLHNIKLPANKSLADVKGVLLSIRADEDISMESFYSISESLAHEFNDEAVITVKLHYIDNIEGIEISLVLTVDDEQTKRANQEVLLTLFE